MVGYGGGEAGVGGHVGGSNDAVSGVAHGVEETSPCGAFQHRPLHHVVSFKSRRSYKTCLHVCPPTTAANRTPSSAVRAKSVVNNFVLMYRLSQQ